ncbi:hypothetical protein AVEN_183628-1, partial [Araneus ventricosus]
MSKSCLGCVILWRAITPNSHLEIIVLKRRQTFQIYLSLLQNLYPKLPSASHPNNFIFLEDNAAIQCRNVVKQWFASQNIKVSNRPPISPDLNIIDNVWGILSDDVNRD